MESIPPRNKDPSPVSDEMVEIILREVRERKNRTLQQAMPDGDLPEQETAQASEECDASASQQEPKKKSGLFWDILFYAALIVFVLGVFLVKSGGNGAPVSIFGVSIHTVLTSSMQDELPKGTLVLTLQVDPASLQIGDDITYMRDETTTITHRIVGIIENYEETGQRAFETQGTMNKEKDSLPVPAANVVGKVIFHNDVLGHIMSFLNQYWQWMLLFIFLFIGLIWALRSWQKASKEEKAERNGKSKHSRKHSS